MEVRALELDYMGWNPGCSWEIFGKMLNLGDLDSLAVGGDSNSISLKELGQLSEVTHVKH